LTFSTTSTTKNVSLGDDEEFYFTVSGPAGSNMTVTKDSSCPIFVDLRNMSTVYYRLRISPARYNFALLGSYNCILTLSDGAY
jgi:hypothetical protein